jgi:hypothetical protein
MPTSRQGRAQQAARHKGERCRHLSGRREADWLKQRGCAMGQAAASGVAQVSAQA